MTPAKLAAARALLSSGEHSMTKSPAAVEVSRATLYRALDVNPVHSYLV